MNHSRNRRVRFHLLATAACIAAVLATAGDASAGTYKVVSCDAASPFGYGTSAWAPYGNAGRLYSSCPSNAGFTSGMSNRLVDETFTSLEHSGYSFTAPPRTSITHLRWAGRMARANCNWTTNIRAVPGHANVLGYPTNQFCDATSFDNRGWPITVQDPRRHNGAPPAGRVLREQMRARRNAALAVGRGDDRRPSAAVASR